MSVMSTQWQTRRSDDPLAALMAANVADGFAGPVASLSLSHARCGVVAVDKGSLHARAVCTCGWQGRQHLLSAIAIHEAHLHSAQNRCSPAVPLFVRDHSLQAFSSAPIPS